MRICLETLATHNKISGELWKRHRKIITPTFHFQILEKHAKVFNSCGKILVERLKEEAGKESFDVAPFIGVFAFDVICGKH